MGKGDACVECDSTEDSAHAPSAESSSQGTTWCEEAAPGAASASDSTVVENPERVSGSDSSSSEYTYSSGSEPEHNCIPPPSKVPIPLVSKKIKNMRAITPPRESMPTPFDGVLPAAPAPVVQPLWRVPAPTTPPNAVALTPPSPGQVFFLPLRN